MLAKVGSSELIWSQAYNLVAAEDSKTAKEILGESATGSTNSTKILQATRKLLLETRNDGRELTNIVSLLTLMFLPGAFISVRLTLFWTFATWLTYGGIFRHELL